MNQTETLIRLPDGCWQVANNKRTLFGADFFDRFPHHALAAQARAIVAAEQNGQYQRIKPLSVNNLKGYK